MGRASTCGRRVPPAATCRRRRIFSQQAPRPSFTVTASASPLGVQGKQMSPRGLPAHRRPETACPVVTAGRAVGAAGSCVLVLFSGPVGAVLSLGPVCSWLAGFLTKTTRISFSALSRSENSQASDVGPRPRPLTTSGGPREAAWKLLPGPQRHDPATGPQTLVDGRLLGWPPRGGGVKGQGMVL